MIKYLFIFLLIAPVFAQEISVNKLTVQCGTSIECENIKKEFKSLDRNYSSLLHLQKILKIYLQSEGIKRFRYELWDDNGKHELKLLFTPKRVVSDVLIDISPDTSKENPTLVEKMVSNVKSLLMPYEYDIDIPTILPLQEGDYIDDNKIQKTIELLKNAFVSKGFPDIKVLAVQKIQDQNVTVTFECYPGRSIQVSGIEIKSSNALLKSLLRKRLSIFQNKPFAIQEIKDVIEESNLLFKDYGYYIHDIQFRYKRSSKYKVTLYIDINDNGLHVFNVTGASKLTAKFLKSALMNYLANYKKILTIENVHQIVEKKYLEYGLLKTVIDVKKTQYKDYLNVVNHRYDITIKEGERSRLKKLSFRGNVYFNKKTLENLYRENAFELASDGVYDLKYYNAFVTTLKEAYLAKGFVNVLVEEPSVTVEKNGDVLVNYRVREGVRTKISKVVLQGVPLEISDELKKLMENKQGKFFNPLAFDNDLEVITSFLNQQGYYFSKITNAISPTLVTYNEDNTEVSLFLDIELDQKLYLNKVIIIGNRKTRRQLIERQLTLKEGDLLTKEFVRESQTNLLSLGLFSSINLTPIKSEDKKVDLLISIKEKDFGLIELAPGVRTDLGMKVSGSLTYLNVDGMNKQLSLQWQVNNRFDLRTLDERRRADSRNLLEYQSSIGFSENNIFNSGMDFSSTISTMRRRFFAFDADIQRFNATISRDWSSWFATSFQLQVESISQFDATEELDHGLFQIGSFTPGITFDFRDNRINPLKGAFLNLSTEFANPTYFSQQDEELVIDYYKIMSRNRFYVPMHNGVIAMSLVAGMQQNLATNKKMMRSGYEETEGYIPDIKVFRLTGIDIVRGFEDDEINRLISGEDISAYRVDDAAYMLNLKFEPRYFLNDSMMFGVFYDAGRVFVDSYDLSKLRSSAGITFKYLTPVGSLDFDYGIKLLRKRNVDGILDSPGRLHVSIGFF